VIGAALRRDEIGQRHIGAALAAASCWRSVCKVAIGLPRDASPNTAMSSPAAFAGQKPTQAAALNQPLSTICFNIFCASS